MALQADRSAYGRMDALVATLNVDTLRQVIKGIVSREILIFAGFNRQVQIN
jgi:hypothetical protein